MLTIQRSLQLDNFVKDFLVFWEVLCGVEHYREGGGRSFERKASICLWHLLHQPACCKYTHLLTNAHFHFTWLFPSCTIHRVAHISDLKQGVANINFRYERIFEYIYIQKMIRTNIRIYSYQKDDTNEYPNIFVSKKQYE